MNSDFFLPCEAFVFQIEMHCVLGEVRTDSLYKMQINFSFQSVTPQDYAGFFTVFHVPLSKVISVLY